MRVISGSFYLTVAGLILKGVIGVMCGSRALVADAVHSLTDSICFGINYGGARVTPDRPLGSAPATNYVIGSAIFLSGVWVCADNTATLIGGSLAHPGLWGPIVAAVSVVVNWRLCRVSNCASRQFGDPNMFVCAVQNRTNFFAACLSLAGVVLAELGFLFLDPLCALVIGGLLVASGAEILHGSSTYQGPSAASIRKGSWVAVGVLSMGMIGFYGFRVLDTFAGSKVVLLPAHGTTSSSPADTVLGRAEYFLIVDTGKGTTTPIMNASRYSPSDASTNLVAIVKNYNVDVVLAHKIGTEMFSDLRSEGVKMYYFGAPQTVGSVLSDYRGGQLELARSPNAVRRYGLSEMRWMRPW
jgi:predicted Fe-Mo cluster-binding NifX family protein